MSKCTKMPEWSVDERHTEPYFDCPKMKRIPCCCCNACPLDTVYPTREVVQGDPNQKCSLSLKKRLAIAARFPGQLKYGGMTTIEFNKRKKWMSMTSGERAKVVQRLSGRRFDTVKSEKLQQSGGG